MKKLSLGANLLLLCLIAFQAIANEEALKANLKGGFEFQSGYGKNNGPTSHKYISKNKQGFAFNSSANFNLNIDNSVENSFSYGAKIGLETTSRNDRRIASSLYLSSNYGKVEAGSEKSANSKMKITGSNIACGTGGGWDSWVTLAKNPEYVAFITNNASYLDAKTREMGKAEYSRKVTYYTPPVKGFQLGVSYIADTTNTGYTALDNPVYHAPVKLSPYYHSMKNGVAYGLTYEYKVDKKFKIKNSFVGEKAKVESFLKSDKKRVKARFKDLNTYTFGSELHYQDYAIAASYANHLKSITSSSIDTKNKDSVIYSLGGRYKFNNLGISVNLFTSDHKNNKVQATTIATEYKIATGLLPYVELTDYQTNGVYIMNGKKFSDKIKGWLFLTGVKLEI